MQVGETLPVLFFLGGGFNDGEAKNTQALKSKVLF